MKLKKKYEAAKTKIKENPYLPVAIAALASGAYAVSVAYRNKNLLDEERRAHSRCHGTAMWLYNNTAEGERTTIEVRDDCYHIVKDEPNPEES